MVRMNRYSSFQELPGAAGYLKQIGVANAMSLFNVDRMPIQGSSYLSSVGYDYDKSRMEVEFTDGAIFQYDCADSEIRDLLDSDSRGQWFYYNIRTSFPYYKIRGPIPGIVRPKPHRVDWFGADA